MLLSLNLEKCLLPQLPFEMPEEWEDEDKQIVCSQTGFTPPQSQKYFHKKCAICSFCISTSDKWWSVILVSYKYAVPLDNKVVQMCWENCNNYNSDEFSPFFAWEIKNSCGLICPCILKMTKVSCRDSEFCCFADPLICSKALGSVLTDNARNIIMEI